MTWQRKAGDRMGEDARFWPKVTQDGDCWRWTGAHVSRGYGSFRLDDGHVIGAHRWAYQALVGEIPDGLELDHLCFVRDCVNPWHLDPVTRLVNVNRGRVNQNDGVETCKHGHPLSGDNVYTYTRNGTARRSCRTCGRERMRAIRSRETAA